MNHPAFGTSSVARAFRFGALACAAATALAFGLSDASASAATSSNPAAASGYTLNTTAIKASMASHHGILTSAEAKRLGLKADTLYLNTPQAKAAKAAVAASSRKAAAAASSALSVRPMSASGCNDSVCIEVIGSGLTVDEWNTFVYVDPGSCSFAAYWEDDEIAFTGEEICAGDDVSVLETYASDFDGEFENGEQLCNTWVNWAGMPCETIEG